MPVDDYQEQEYEFWRRLEEEPLDRRRLLKRGLAAGAGLSIFSLSDLALATRQRVLQIRRCVAGLCPLRR